MQNQVTNPAELSHLRVGWYRKNTPFLYDDVFSLEYLRKKFYFPPKVLAPFFYDSDWLFLVKALQDSILLFQIQCQRSFIVVWRMKEYILPSIFLSTMYRSMYLLRLLKYILMVLFILGKKMPILCYMTSNDRRNFAAYLSLSHHCRTCSIVHAEMEEGFISETFSFLKSVSYKD